MWTPDISHIGITGPPFTETFLSFPAVAKAIMLLSGDQNGESAPSLPSTARGCC